MRNATYFVVIAIGLMLTLIYGQSLIIPFIFALGFWFLTKELRKLLDRVGFIKKYFTTGLKNIFVFILMVLVLGFAADLLTNNITALSNSFDQYEPNIDALVIKLSEIFHVNLQNSIESALGDFEFASFLRDILNGLSSILGNTFMIIIYALFIFLEETTFKSKLEKVFVDKEKYAMFNRVLGDIEYSVFNYLRLKTLVSVLTGGLSFIVLAIVGIDAPFFWAFLIFLLNYIPTVGSLVATVFPAVFSLIQFGEFTPFLIVLLIVGAVQVVVGNVLEPRIMGNSLNLSPLVTIIALAIWGQIWGVPGMILSVPITVIVVIVLSQFESTKNVAIMLSENGKVNGET